MKTTIGRTTGRIAGLLIAVLSLAFSASGQVSFRCDTVEAQPGDSVTVPVYISNFTNGGSLTLYIQYNSGSVTYGSAQGWNSAFGLTQPLIFASNGVIGISWVNVYGTTIGSGTLVNLRFLYNQGMSNLTFASNCEATDVNGNPMTTVFNNGWIKRALSLSVSASPTQVCSGSNTQLTSTVAGGSGNYSYAWSSVPAGFSSSAANPTVSPAVNTTYTCQVSDGFKSLSASTSISIFTGSAPATPSNLLPANNSQNVASPVTFSWSSSLGATAYDLYIWPFAQNQPSTPTYPNITQISQTASASSSGNLVFGQEYKWTVVAKNPCYSVSGPVQTFKVRALPDLHVTNITFTQPVAGQPMTITWTIKNDGDGPTVENQWYERVWLTPDIEVRIGEEDDILLAQYPNISYLPAGASYTQTQTILMPAGISGPYFLWVIVDDLDALFIQWPPSGPPLPYNPPPYINSWTHGGSMVNVVTETNERDNFLYREVIFPAAPTPDLKPIASVNPSSAFSGQPINIQWTIKNAGAIAINTTQQWFDRIFLSADTIFDAGTDYNLGSFQSNGPVQLDSSYTRAASVTVPNFISGTYYLYVVADATSQIFEYVFESNNIWRFDSMTIILTPPPDLIVPILTIPDTVSNGEWVPIIWQVQNLGGSATIAPDWKDRVYLSTNPDGTLNGATAVGVRQQSSTLQPGNAYTANLSIQIPPGLSGDYYVLVKADYNDDVFEYTNEGNNILRSDTTLRIITPDLSPAWINAPTIDSTGQAFSVSWWTRNLGAGKAIPDWKESLYITSNPNFSLPALVSVIKDVNSDLNAGDSVLMTEQVSLPANNPGPFFVHIISDVNNSVFESSESNNVSSGSSAINVYRPDLVVQQFSSPASDTSGNTIALHWVVKNNGQAKSSGSWKDKVFISRFSSYHPDSLKLLGSVIRTKELLVGDTAMQSLQVMIPNGYSGLYYLYLLTDADNQIYERLGENNNASGAMPIQVTLGPWADLQFVLVSAPDTFNIGYSVIIPYKVINDGTRSVSGKKWTDKVYLSIDPSWNPLTATFMGQVQHVQLLMPDSSYTANFSFSVPLSMASGHYWVYTVLDETDTVYEHSDEVNNLLRSGPIFLKPYPPVDLLVSAFSAPNAVNSGAQISLNWSVYNNSTVPTLPAFWLDAAYLSSDSILSSNDLKLDEWQKSGPMLAGATYTQSKTLSIPNGTSGTFYFLLVCDIGNSNNDANRNNNTGKDRNSGFVALPVTITLTPPPDLQVANFAAPPSTISGQPMEVIWAILNGGTNTTVPGTWSDKFYLSTDFVVDASDILVYTQAHSGALNPGQYYVDTAMITIPVQYAGNYILLLKTDANNELFEHLGEGNNVGSSLLYVSQAPPADLVVKEITIPGTALVGSQVSITWKVKNEGQFAANGQLRDIVYVSDDGFWDANDQVLGTTQSNVSIAPLTQINRNLSAVLPGVSVGDYHFIVRTDILNNINETNDTNNTASSFDSTSVTVKTLPFNTIVIDTLYDFTNLYYKVEVEDSLEGETMLARLKGDSLFGTNELYIRHNLMASRVNFDYSHSDPFKGVQEVLVPTLDDGNYYLLFFGNTPTSNLQQVEIQARILDFEILNVSGTKGGNGGIATVMISGSKFDSLMQVRLINGSNEISAHSLYYIDISHCVASFNLAGQATGLYDLVAINTPGDTATLADAYEIVSATAPELGLVILSPPNTRLNRVSAFTVEFENIGTVDILNPVLQVQSYTSSPIALDVAGLSANLHTLSVPLHMDQGPPGIIPPGYRGRVVVYTYSSEGLGFTIAVPGYY
jgi:subtilase family serine protease